MKLRFLLAMLLSITLASCATTPLTQIENFAESTAKLTEATDEVIDEYNQATVTEQLQNLKHTHFKPVPGGSAQVLLDIDALAQIKNVFGSDAKKKLSIYRANKAVNDYAKSLKALAEAGEREEISKASVELISSLSELEESIGGLKGDGYQPKLDDEKLGLLGAAIDLIGSEIAEHKRREALKDIITSANPQIKVLMNEVVKQLDKLNYETHLNDYSYAALSRRIMDYNLRVSRGEYSAKPEKQFEDLQKLWKDTQIHVVNSKKFKHLKKSLLAIATEHEKIAQQVKKDKFSSKEIIAAAKTIQAKKKRFDEFKEAIVTCDTVGFDDNNEPVCEDKDPEEKSEEAKEAASKKTEDQEASE